MLPAAVEDYSHSALHLHHRTGAFFPKRTAAGLANLFHHQFCSLEVSLVATRHPTALPVAVDLVYLGLPVRPRQRVEASLVAVEAVEGCSKARQHQPEEGSSLVLQPGRPHEDSLVMRPLLVALRPIMEPVYLVGAFLAARQQSLPEEGSLEILPPAVEAAVADVEIR